MSFLPISHVRWNNIIDRDKYSENYDKIFKNKNYEGSKKVLGLSITNKIMSPKFRLNKEDLLKILKVLGYVAASAVIVELINLVPSMELPVWCVPIVNIILVTLKKFFSGESTQK